jgi:multisubunit Na+/H+ antiporter MnhB subunit
MFGEPVLSESQEQSNRMSAWIRVGVAIVVTCLCSLVIVLILQHDKGIPPLARLALSNLEFTGVENPVTAVLLNYRSYDTLLEIAVLMIVAVTVLPNFRCDAGSAQPFVVIDKQHEVDPILAGLVKWLISCAVISGGYLLWTGAHAPGGAFQAGAVIAGGGVALAVVGKYRFNWLANGVSVAIVLGLAVFMGVAGLSKAMSGVALAFPVDEAGLLILIVEIAATVSIALILLLLFTELND